MSYLISIIMPAYNAERYIGASIQSVLKQTYANWELIVIDDGSTDRTAEIVRSFLAADSRIKYFLQPNGGQGKARNTGIMQSSGELIAFLDSDDLWESEKLALQVQIIAKTGADLVFSDALIFSADEKTDGKMAFSTICPEFIYGQHDGSHVFKLLFAYNRIPTLTVLTRKEILHEVGLFDEEIGRSSENSKHQICEDYELWLRLAKYGAVFFGMKEKLARYRRHSASTMNGNSKLLKATAAILKKYNGDSGLDVNEVKRTIRNLYRSLISTLIEENKIADARDYMKEFSAWDRSSLITPLQKILIKVAPGKYNFISKECLYRIEWHLAKLLG